MDLSSDKSYLMSYPSSFLLNPKWKKNKGTIWVIEVLLNGHNWIDNLTSQVHGRRGSTRVV